MKKLPFPAKIILLNAILFYGMVVIAIFTYEHPFSPINTNMSRLGRPSYHTDLYWIYIVACMIGALLQIPYYRSLKMWLNGDKLINLGIRAIMILGYLSCFGLFFCGLFHADLWLEHRIFGGIYFFSDIFIMFLVSVVVWKHPKMDKAIIPVCILSAVLNAYFLQSGGKISWAEWSTVLLSFTVALWLGLNSARLETSDTPEPAFATTK